MLIYISQNTHMYLQNDVWYREEIDDCYTACNWNYLSDCLDCYPIPEDDIPKVHLADMTNNLARLSIIYFDTVSIVEELS